MTAFKEVKNVARLYMHSAKDVLYGAVFKNIEAA